MFSAGTGVKGSSSRRFRYWISGQGFADRWRRLGHRWPMAVVSVGVIGSFVWAALLVWLLLDLINRLV